MITIDMRPFLCRKCGQKFEAEVLGNVAIDVWVAHTKNMRCPNCGAGYKKISFMLEQPPDESNGADAE